MSLEAWALEEKPKTVSELERVRTSYLASIQRDRAKRERMEEWYNFFDEKLTQTQLQLDFLRANPDIRRNIPQLIAYKEMLILLWRGLKEACV